MRIFLSFILCFVATDSLYSQQFAYVVNSVGKSISIIDLETNATVGYVDNNSFDINNPLQVMFNPDGTRAYVVSDFVNSVFIIDPTINKIIGEINDSSFPFSAPSNIDITPDGLKAYVANQGSSQVSIIDLTTSTVVGNVNFGAFPFNLPIRVTIDSLGAKAYVTNLNGDNVSVIDVATDTVTQYVTNTIATPFSHPFRVRFIDNTKAYITNLSGASAQAVSIVDYATDTVTGYVNPGAFPFINAQNIAISPFTPRAFIENSFNDKISIIDTTTDTAIDYYPFLVFHGPDSAHSSFDGLRLYIVNKTSNVINVIDTVTTLPLTNVDTSAFPLNAPVSIDLSPFIAPPPPPPPPPPTPVPPPTNVQGFKQKVEFAMQTDLVNIITWEPPLGGNLFVAYKIYKDAALTKLLGTVSVCGPLRFEHHNRRKGHTNNYFIVAVYADGSISGPVSISLTW